MQVRIRFPTGFARWFRDLSFLRISHRFPVGAILFLKLGKAK